MDILAPGDVQELVLSGWTYRADGKFTPAYPSSASSDEVSTTLLVQMDKLKYTVEAAINLTETETADFTTISQLTMLLNSKLAAADWVVIQSDAPDTGVTPLLNTVYRGFDAMRTIDGRDASDTWSRAAAGVRPV